MKPIRLAACALAALAVGCSTLQVNTDYAPGTDFSKYKTFTMVAPTSAKNPIAAERLVNAIGNALSARGLQRVEQGGDLDVHPHFVVGKDTQINTSGYGYGGWGGWRWGGTGMQTTTVQEIPTGTLVVDLVDSKTKGAVWRGVAKDNISTDATPEERQAKADEVCKELFANFPPAAKK